MKIINRKFLTRAAATATAVVTIAATAPFAAFAADPAPNPALGNACGLDVVLILDVSGSISPTELTQMKGAAKNFVDAFLPGTPTTMGVVQFHTGATVVQDLTSDPVDLKADIDTVSGGGLTNWEDALLKSRGLLEGGLDRDDSVHPDLMVIFTDGNPTNSNSGGDDLDNAIAEANNAKTSSSTMPIRIVGVGIGTGVTVSSMVAITGPIVSPPASTTKDTDVIMSDFDQLAVALGDLAKALCANANPPICSGNDNVVVENDAVVTNVVESGASTGGNWAGGSTGGDGGRGGRIYNGGSGAHTQNVSDSSTGNGGNGGNAGVGGTVDTGDASSTASLSSHVNVTDIDIERCCCGEGKGGSQGDTNTIVRNRALSTAVVLSGADTGDNGADGSTGGSGGAGGDIYNGGIEPPEGSGDTQKIDDTHTGSGGNGGASGDEEGAAGGFVRTGRSDSSASATSVVNSTVVRIRR